MKKTIGISSLALVLLGFFAFLTVKFIPETQNLNSCNEFKSTEEEGEIIKNFSQICYLNQLKADSMKQLVNQEFNYPYHFTASFRKKYNRDRNIFSFMNDVPYYGMTDGYKGFLFSLHTMKVKKINIYWGGGNNFYAYNYFSFLENDFVDFDLHTFDIKISEHEKVINIIKGRCNDFRQQRYMIDRNGLYYHTIR